MTDPGDGLRAIRGGGAGCGRILAVDDEPRLLVALRRTLEADSQRVDVALPGELDRYLGDPALDVLLLDVHLGPGAPSGLDVLERVKRERPDVEVVVLTADASIEGAVQCMRQGAFDYVAKPFHVERMRATVREAVARRRRANCRSEQAFPLSLEAYERMALERALRESDGDASAAARRLGIGRSTFYRKLAQHRGAVERATNVGGPTTDDVDRDDGVGRAAIIG